MRIIVHPDGEGSLFAEAALQIAMQVLRDDGVRLEGGGLIGKSGQWEAVILLSKAGDSDRALKVLARADIKAST